MPPWANGGSGTGEYELILSAVSDSSLGRTWQSEDEFARHPDYKVLRPGGCTFCLMDWVRYADHISQNELYRLTDYNLSCVTRWKPCVTLEELLPASKEWGLYGSPWGEAEKRAEWKPPPSCTIPVYALARDSDALVEVEAMEDSAVQADDVRGSGESLRVKVSSVLKGASP